ncbi:MAG: histidine--tRNA ligase [Kiritimatiellae bacterium]|nr:histidine--tRNA ligase [Kiritimatiellia bacterium]
MPASKPSLKPPRGMRDFYPEDMTIRNAIFDAWTTAAQQFGFSNYDACIVETLDLLRRKSGEEIDKQIYAFQDKSGRDLALRPEMTPTLARMVAARQPTLTFPLKWFTIAQCFRYERTTRGRKREHYQWNMDIIGEDEVSAEVEVIAAAITSLLAMGLSSEDFRVHFSSRALVSDILSHLGIIEEHHQAVFLALDKQGKQSDDDIKALLKDQGIDSETTQQIFTIMNISNIDDAVEVLGEEMQSVKQIREFLDLISAYDMENILVFDISVIRGLAYYTGIVFEAFDTKKELRALFGGGRYDNLMAEMGGTSTTGVGLGFGDVVISELLQQSTKLPDYSPTHLAIGYMTNQQRSTATAIASAMRRSGTSIDLALHSEKPKTFFSRAGKTGFKEAIYIGPDDVTAGTIRIKDLTTRTEREEQIPELLSCRAV